MPSFVYRDEMKRPDTSRTSFWPHPPREPVHGDNPLAPGSFIARLVAVKFTSGGGKLPLPGALAQARKRLDLKRVDSKPAAETELEAVQALCGDGEWPVLVRRPDFNVCDRIPVEVAEHVVCE